MAKALIDRRIRRGNALAPMVMGVELADAKEEIFVLMVCDGLPMGIAFRKAGFDSKDGSAPSKLWALDRCQQRALAILEARKATAAVTLPQVTSMLERVYSSALHNENESAAHNAAFSLARLYGHVTDRAQLEVVRKPSRDPEAPSEQSLSDWVAGLVDVSPSAIAPQIGAEISPRPGAPAPLLGDQASVPGTPYHTTDNATISNDINGLSPHTGFVDRASLLAPAAGNDGETKLSNEINWLAGGGSENGAPTEPVTGTPTAGARTEVLDPFAEVDIQPRRSTPTTPLNKKGLKSKRVPVKKRGKGKKPVFKRTVIPDLFK